MSHDHAVHGGAFFDAIGVDFASLERANEVVSADVLDAWYDPSPRVISALREHLPWLIKTSPPTHGEGLRRVISETRGVPEDKILLGAGSTPLMYLAFPHLVQAGDQVTLLDPMYGEYDHIFRQVLGCRIVNCELLAEEDFRPDVQKLIQASQGSKLVVLVNPNSPTGVAVDQAFIAQLLAGLAPTSKVWIDETYIDFMPEACAETLVASEPRLIIGKSMSKYYGLSGLRVGYLVATPTLIKKLEPQSPPWGVGLLGQVGAVEALRDAAYYTRKVAETHQLRTGLAEGLASLDGVRVIPSSTNFLMIELSAPRAQELVDQCAKHDVFLRNCDSLSPRFQGRYIRIAVKTQPENERIIQAIRNAL